MWIIVLKGQNNSLFKSVIHRHNDECFISQDWHNNTFSDILNPRKGVKDYGD